MTPNQSQYHQSKHRYFTYHYFFSIFKKIFTTKISKTRTRSVKQLRNFGTTGKFGTIWSHQQGSTNQTRSVLGPNCLVWSKSIQNNIPSESRTEKIRKYRTSWDQNVRGSRYPWIPGNCFGKVHLDRGSSVSLWNLMILLGLVFLSFPTHLHNNLQIRRMNLENSNLSKVSVLF